MDCCLCALQLLYEGLGTHLFALELELERVVVYLYDEFLIFGLCGVKVTDVPFEKLRWIAKDFICNQITDANGNLVAEDLEVYPVMIDTFVIWKDKDGNPHALPDGQPRNISKNHVITLTTDRASEYSVYFKVANELYGAYNELRDKLAREAYGRPYSELDGNQQEVCQQYYKLKIYEAKPQEYTETVQ